MINNKNYKTVDADYPILYFDKFLNDDVSKALCNEIEDFSSFDEITNEPISRFNHDHKNDVAFSNKTLIEMGFPPEKEACECEDCRADWFLQLGTDIIADRSLKTKKSTKKSTKIAAEGYPSKKVTHHYTQIT